MYFNFLSLSAQLTFDIINSDDQKMCKPCKHLWWKFFF